MTTELTEAVASTESPAVDAGIEDLVAVAKETMATDAADDVGAPAIPIVKPEDEETETVQAGHVVTGGTVARAIRAAKERQKLRASEQSRVQQENARIQQQEWANTRREQELEQTRISLEQRQAQINEALHDPARFSELTGVPQQELASRWMIAGSPEQQLQRKAELKLAELETKLKAQETAWQQHQEQLKKQQESAREQEVRRTEASFVQHSAEAEKYPNLAKLPDKVRLDWGYDIAAKYYEATKKVASDAEIAEHIETELSGEPAVPQLSQRTATNGKAPTNRANGPRTLSKVAASERRSAPRPLRNDMSQEELMKELIATAREANMTQT